MNQSAIECLKTIKGFQEHVPLAPFTTFKIGGPADMFIDVSSIEDLQKTVRCILDHNIPFNILGGGSNVLISDKGFRGVILHPNFHRLEKNGTTIIAGSGVLLSKLILFARDLSLTGLEHLTGIPGTVGGALAGNAGSSNKWINSAVTEVTAVKMSSGEIKKFKASECGFGYRTSIFKDTTEYFLVEGVFSLEHGNQETIKEAMSELMKKRNKQPAGKACAGCAFKNPKEDPAGKIIERLGLKGKKIGKVMVSPDHGNFIVNTGGASAEEVVMLISYLKQQVRDKEGIQLQEEIRYIGF